MNQNQINLLIDSFGGWYADASKAVESFEFVAESAKRGYLAHPDIYNVTVLKYVKSKEMNPNSTFYKSFQDVVEKSRIELLIDQIFHYMSTYGTGYTGETYVPNAEPEILPYHTFKVLKAYTKKEVFDKAMGLIQSGIALRPELVDAVAEFVFRCEDNEPSIYKIDLSTVKNKEAAATLLEKQPNLLNTANIDQMMRVFALKATGKAMIVQSIRDFKAISRNDDACAVVADLICSLSEQKLAELSLYFRRYRMFFLAIKKGLHQFHPGRGIINRLKRMSDVDHKPFVPGFWEAFTSRTWKSGVDDAMVQQQVDKLDNPFKVVKLLEMFRLIKIQAENNHNRIFKIRNGRVFCKKETVEYPKFYTKVASMLTFRLIELMKVARDSRWPQGPVYVRIPKNLELMLPSSEKTFIGNVPFGSTYQMTDHDNYFGIYWRNEWGTHDFDLHLVGDNGTHIGWNASYYSNNSDVVFSGDMTDADPEATEMFRIRKGCPDGNITINRYNGKEGSKYRLFFGQSNCPNFGKNYMVDPNSILCQVDMVSEDQQEIVGRIKGNKVYLMKFENGNRLTPQYAKDFNNSVDDLCMAHIPLEPFLKAIYVEWDPTNPDHPQTPDIDLTNDLQKDTILNLMSCPV